ncbi:MAG TPA: DUF4337 domain-containing protein [Stellaceae bacterium]|nr:DUF4337 domain-containing protein [Stellaceae bacterium]
MEPHEIAETIPGREEAEHRLEVDDKFRKFTGIYVGVVAMLLAIATLGGANATKQMLSANISASDTYAYYQAKILRQAAFEIAADQIDTMLAAQPGMAAEPQQKARALSLRYRKAAARSLSDPQSGHGQKELLAKAQELEAKRARAEERNPNFEFAEALYQIAIVLGSVSIVAASRRLLDLSGVLATVATLLTINGYFLLVPMPFG